MGTNYYVQEKPPCESCGRPYENRHIGKSAAGWCFALRIYPDEGINTLEDWKGYLGSKPICDEYGDIVHFAEMLAIITQRYHRDGEEKWTKPPHGYAGWQDFHRDNHSEEGPNGLLRSKIDGRRCVGHGDGTWDLYDGEFF